MGRRYIKPVINFIWYGDSYPKPVDGDRYLSMIEDSSSAIWKSGEIVEVKYGQWVGESPQLGDLVYVKNANAFYIHDSKGNWGYITALDLIEHLKYQLHTCESYDKKVVQILDEYYENGEKNGK
ncbi:MAG TPA: hypothetical protein VMX17_03450 [Candidatus Glassbacteria bacterium]|nr:hypothetical protein [Candidatus Glassbacteria bacterium]